jgi:outer membrane lipoprotein SlyB
MNRSSAAMVPVLALALVACARSYEPIVDTYGVDPARYEADLDDCRAYAEQVSPLEEAGGGALLGGAIGAALGAIAGAFSGDAGTGAAVGAAVGGAGGGISGGAEGVAGQRQVIRNCMSGRGYSILR